MKKFHYQNTEKRVIGGKRITRQVHVRGNQGFKTVTHTMRGGRKKTVKRPLRPEDIHSIKKGVFVKGLFNDCLARI